MHGVLASASFFYSFWAVLRIIRQTQGRSKPNHGFVHGLDIMIFPMIFY